MTVVKTLYSSQFWFYTDTANFVKVTCDNYSYICLTASAHFIESPSKFTVLLPHDHNTSCTG